MPKPKKYIVEYPDKNERTLRQAERNAMIAAYKKAHRSANMREISLEFGVSMDTVGRVLRRYGIIKDKKKIPECLDKETAERIMRMRRKGATYNEIAAIVGMPYETVKAHVHTMQGTRA